MRHDCLRSGRGLGNELFCGTRDRRVPVNRFVARDIITSVSSFHVQFSVGHNVTFCRRAALLCFRSGAFFESDDASCVPRRLLEIKCAEELLGESSLLLLLPQGAYDPSRSYAPSGSYTPRGLCY